VIHKVIENVCLLDSENIVSESKLKNRNETKEISFEGNYFIVSAHPIQVNGIECLITIVDITNSVLQRITLLQSSKMLAVGQLAAGMAHEIRNPLGIIRTQSYLLKLQAKSENEKKSIKYIEESVSSASDIIDSILNFWKEGNVEEKSVNLNDELENIIEINKSEFKKKNIEILYSLIETIYICESEDALKHIFLNLLNNAADSMKDGGQISINIIKTEKTVTIEVLDEGVGISVENLKNIYNPFFTTKAPGEGTGLGLFIVYSAVEKLSGKIFVESKVGEGTKFTVVLPVEDENERKTEDINC
jgi:polar amino acid transport system substrate-binding protein